MQFVVCINHSVFILLTSVNIFRIATYNFVVISQSFINSTDLSNNQANKQTSKQVTQYKEG